MSRRMVQLIHANGFFPNNDAENLKNLSDGLQFVESSHGMEVQNFNLIFPDSELIFHKVLGERVIVDTKKSGVLRKPNNNLIHFEEFETTDEWCFIVALEKTTVNFWYHIDPTQSLGELGEPNAKTVFDGYKFNYRNLFEWKIHTNIILETNQCLFYRPWVFTSLESGVIQYYRLLADSNFRILVMGMPGSCKSSIAKKLSEKFESSNLIISNQERILAKDVDYTVDGQMRHCYRMLNLARQSKAKATVIDMACPLPKMRQILNADIVVWVSDKTECEYEELNQIYIPPIYYDIECTDDNNETIDKIIKRIFSKKL
jgi:hypothetical protein